MRVSGIIANLRVPDLAAAGEFYRGYLGLEHQELGLGWVTRYVSPDGRASVQLLTKDATAAVDPVVSLPVGARIEEAYAEAVGRGYRIAHPLTTEPWGLRRFFVQAPDGNVFNVTSHPAD